MIDHFCHVWLDTSKGKNKRTLAECIQAAQASHQRRAGCDATVCYINANVHPDAPAVVEDVHIKRDKGVQSNQYWMAANGVEPPADEPEPVEEAEPVASPLEREAGYYRKCPDENCRAEQPAVNKRCWFCDRDLRIKEAA